MNDYSKTYFHLEKSESFMDKKRMNTENKQEIKFEKFKKIIKPKDNLSIKHRLLKKMNQQKVQMNKNSKKLNDMSYIKEKYKSETKKLKHNKSYNFKRNKPDDINIKINNTNIPKQKSLKKINFTSALNQRFSLNNNEKNIFIIIQV